MPCDPNWIFCINSNFRDFAHLSKENVYENNSLVGRMSFSFYFASLTTLGIKNDRESKGWPELSWESLLLW